MDTDEEVRSIMTNKNPVFIGKDTSLFELLMIL